MRILLVEDHPLLGPSTAQGLREAGFAVDLCTDGGTGLRYARQYDYDVMIIDVMLPQLDGLSILRTLRDAGSESPVLLLTARDGIDDRVAGLDAGADDYLVKPFALAELLARIRALVRRKYQPKRSLVQIADLELDTSARRVRRAGHDIALTAREYALLEYLALRRGQIVSRDEMQEHVCDATVDTASNILDVYISQLRKKIDRSHPVKLIHTCRGQGYMLDEREP